MAPSITDSIRDPKWADNLQVDEKRLQEYLARKQHGVVLAGAAELLKKTLVSAPTTHAGDGCLHFGDSLMLCSQRTDCLLQADVTNNVTIRDNSYSKGREFTGATLSTGKILYACPRNVFTISRVEDKDGFGEDPAVHYGQPLRIGANPSLCDNPMYVYAGDQVEAPKESRSEEEESKVPDMNTMAACLFPRAAKRCVWHVVHVDAAEREATKGQPVLLHSAVALQNADTGALLMSDTVICLNRYGNECRVFAAESSKDNLAHQWSFVDETWTQGVIQNARSENKWPKADVADITDPADLIENPGLMAAHELKALNTDSDVSRYAVCARIFPMLRHSGMHGVRKARRMCFAADIKRNGTCPARTLEGILSYMAVRLCPGEYHKLLELFETSPGSDHIDYVKFFRLMEVEMPESRQEVVQDAYARLTKEAAGGWVNITDIQRLWQAQCYPEVQSGQMSATEAHQDFMRQWVVLSADGAVSYDEFLDYYRDVSMAIEKNSTFVEIVRRAWDL
jgi:hypothetical protein